MVPHGTKGTGPKCRHETYSVLEIPAQEQHEHSFCSSSSNTFITGLLYTVHRYRSSPGAPDLWQGWADSKAVHKIWNVAGCARSTGDFPLSRGCCRKCTVLQSTRRCAHPHDLMLNKPLLNYQQQQTPGSCARVVYIAGDTLHHQPLWSRSHDCAPVTWAIWHSVSCNGFTQELVSTRKTSCCTRMITLYGARKWIQARALHTAQQ